MSIEAAAWKSMMYQIQGEGPGVSMPPRLIARRVLKFASEFRTRIAVYLALSIVGAVLIVMTPVLAGRAIDSITTNRSVREIVLVAGLIAVVAILEAVVATAIQWQATYVGESLVLKLRTSVFDHILKMPVAFFSRAQTGALVSRVDNDVLGANRAISDTLAGIVSNSVVLVLTLATMLSLSWQITLCTLALFPLFLWPAKRVGRRLASLYYESASLEATMTARMTERFSAPGATLVKLFSSRRHESKEFHDRADRVREIHLRTEMVQWSFVTALTLASSLAVAVVYGIGGILSADGTIPAGTIVTLALLLTRLYTPLVALGSARAEVTTALVSFERIFEVLDLNPALPEPKEAASISINESRKPHIEFRDVSFSYPPSDQVSLASLESVDSDFAAAAARENKEVLRGISISVSRGDTVALVGPSGAGKSTLVNLVARLYDATTGAVLVHGVDVRDVSTEELRRHVGMVTQDCHLFHDTIRENLLIADRAASDELLVDVLKRARLQDFLDSAPEGLSTVVGDSGYRLSGGERQRLAIARVLLKQPAVVILDEATAHLDIESELAVRAAFDEVLHGRTVLVIAHRLSTIKNANRILFIEDGEVSESGTHDQLMQRNGRYKELYLAQFSNSRIQ